MRSRILAALMIAVPAIVQPAFAQKAERASMDEAKAMATKAAVYARDHGRGEGVKAFMAPGGQWHDRDLYVFMLDSKGVSLANSASPSMVGKDRSELQDVSGKYFVKEFLKVKAEAWVEYLWRNPKSDEIEMKTSYVVKLPDGGVVGVGAYKQ